MEVWKPIVGYETTHMVSNLGRIRSLDRTVKCRDCYRTARGRILSVKTTPEGYWQVTLSNGGIDKTHYVHRLVAKAFIPNPNDLPEVNHKDEDKSNNCVDNLEWCTRKYNSRYNDLNHRIGLKRRGKIINGTPILQFTLDGIFICEYGSSHEAQRLTGIDSSYICKVINGKAKSAGGYKWKRK